MVLPVACIARLPPLAPQTAVDSRIEPSEERRNMSENIISRENDMYENVALKELKKVMYMNINQVKSTVICQVHLSDIKKCAVNL